MGYHGLTSQQGDILGVARRLAKPVLSRLGLTGTPRDIMRSAVPAVVGAVAGRIQGRPSISGIAGPVPVPAPGVRAAIARVLPGGATGTISMRQIRGAVIAPTPGMRGALQRALPGGEPGFMAVRRRRRQMDFGNTKALNRASRRIDGFLRLAKTALRHTGYKVVAKKTGKAATGTRRKRAR